MLIFYEKVNNNIVLRQGKIQFSYGRRCSTRCLLKTYVALLFPVNFLPYIEYYGL